MTKRDACGTDHVVRFTRPSGSVFAYCKRSKTGAGEGLGTRLALTPPKSATALCFLCEKAGSGNETKFMLQSFLFLGCMPIHVKLLPTCILYTFIVLYMYVIHFCRSPERSRLVSHSIVPNFVAQSVDLLKDGTLISMYPYYPP